MKVKAGARRHAGSVARRQRWIMVLLGVLALYSVLMLQMWIWSAASRADLNANISTDRAPMIVSRLSTKRVEEPSREEQKSVESKQSATQAVGAVNELPNLRVLDPPLSTPDAGKSSSFERKATLAPAATTALTTSAVQITKAHTASSFAARHDTVSGYSAAMQYLANYTIPADSDERLFLFFVCGDKTGKQTTWRKICIEASTVVYDVFAKSSRRNRLVTIHAGSKTDWSKANEFYNDVDLKVKMIPALMQWQGGRPNAKRATSGMILENSILYEPLLRYLFKNEDVLDPLLAPEKIASKEIVLLKGYTNYRQYVDTLASGENPSINVPTGPLFFFFIAGRLGRNDRPWCPYCRFSDISVEYAFYAFAPPGSRLVKVETVDSYSTWKSPQNEWKSDTSLMVRGVPWMYRAHLDTEGRKLSFIRVHGRFDHPAELQGLFQT